MTSQLSRRFNMLVALLMFALLAHARGAAAQMVISQVYGGGGNSGAVYTNDFVELHNNGVASIDLSGWSLQYTSATGTSWGSQKTTLSGIVPAGGYLLVQMGSGGANGIALPAPDLTGTTNMSATAGKIALVNSTTSLAAATCPSDPSMVDVVGYGATANCYETASAPAPSASLSIQRGGGGCTDTQNNAADFSTAAPIPRNASTTPLLCSANQAIVAACTSFNTVQAIAGSSLISASDIDGIVNGVGITSGAVPGITLGTFTAAGATGGTASVRVEVAASVAVGTYPLTATFSNADPQSTPCNFTVTVLTPPAVLTTVPAIQGVGSASLLVGQSVTARGVVTAVWPGLQGYHIQEETGDGNALTSDGLFIYNGVNPITVLAGERVQVTGLVSEFASFAGNPTVTELTSPTNVAKLGVGSIPPALITLPELNEGDFERYEGMLVQITSTLTASQNFFQGRYGQVTLSASGRMIKPTNTHRPGTPGALSMAADNARRRLVLDDGRSAENFFSGVENPNPIPYIGADSTLRAGDTVTNLVGIVDFGRITNATGASAIVDYKIHPVLTPIFTRVNVRQSTPPAIAGTHRVASFNVLNYFTTFTDGTTATGGSGQGCLPSNTTSDCRGASNATEFTRQRDKIIRAIAALDADVVGLMEIQRNAGVATQNLVDGLNAYLGSTLYARVPDPVNVGTDAIQVTMIYKPARLTLVGGALSDGNAIHNRPPVAQTFQAANGAKFSVVVNHFKSKGCDGAAGADVDQGDGQGCFNDRRTQQSSALLAFVSTVQTAAADNDVMIIGDLNAYGKEDPIDTLVTGGMEDQIARFQGGSAYSYVFDGEAGYLDHALASASLSPQVVATTHWSVNADEPSVIDYQTEFKPQDLYAVSPYRSSDHDPVLVGINLAAPPASQTITFGPLAGRYLDESPVTLSATASSGLIVAFSSLTPLVCSISGNSALLLQTGTCTIAANQPGNAVFLAAPQITQGFLVSPARTPQTITFTGVGVQVLGTGPINLSVTASSGLTVAVASLTPSVCGVTGLSVALLDAGQCDLVATQTGNASFAAATPVSTSFAIVTTIENADVPLPFWAVLALGGALLGASRRLRPGIQSARKQAATL